MDNLAYSHVIQSIENIREDGKVNKYHEHILGKRCSIQCGQEHGCMCSMVVEPFWIYTEPKWFYTTIIDKVETHQDGTIVMQTQNTIYTFSPIPEGEDNDLSGQRCNNTD